MTQREAYDACVKLAIQNNWGATACALVEDGFDEVIDFLSLYHKWKVEEEE